MVHEISKRKTQWLFLTNTLGPNGLDLFYKQLLSVSHCLGLFLLLMPEWGL